MRATWILADPHAGADPDADRALLELLGAASVRDVDLLLLGDLFLAWLARPRFYTPLQRSVMDTLARLRDAGRRVDFVIGNRDYLAEGLAGRAFDRVLDGEVVIELGGVPTFVAHGDRLNARDHLYRAWYRTSRSAPATFALEHLPGAAGRWLAAKTERSLDGTNRAYKTGLLPLASLEAFGRRALAAGAERALVGHFHHDRALDVAGGAPVIVAPGWLETRRVLVAEPGSRALRSTPLDALGRGAPSAEPPSVR